MAYEQAKTIYDQLSAKQKKMTKVLINAEGKLSHPLSIHVRNEWQLADSQLLFQEKITFYFIMLLISSFTCFLTLKIHVMIHVI